MGVKGDRGQRRGPAAGRRRRRALVAAGLLAAALVGLLLGRDRLLLWAARRVLARTFPGRVSIGSAHLVSLRRFTLGDLSVETGPGGGLSLQAVRVSATIRTLAQALGGRLASAELVGAQVTLDLEALTRRPPPRWLQAGPPLVGEARLRRSTLRLVGPLGSAEFSVGSLVMRGTRFQGSLRAGLIRDADGRPRYRDLSAEVEGEYDPAGPSLRLRLRQVPLAPVLGALREAPGGPEQASGSLSLEVTARWPSAGPSAQGALALEQAAGTWPSAGAEWEGLNGLLNFHWQQTDEAHDLGASLRLDAGGVLVGGAYLDLGEHPFEVALAGRWLPRRGRFVLEDLSSKLAGLAEAALVGEVDRGAAPRARFEGEVYLPRLEAAGSLARSALAGRSTVFAAVEVGGRLEATFTLEVTPERTDLRGRLGWYRGRLKLGPLALRGVSLALPFRVARGGGEFLDLGAEEVPPYGLLAVRGLRLGSVPASLGPVPLRVVGDELQFAEREQRLALLGGEVVVRGLRYRRLWGGSPEVTSRVEARGLSLAQLTADSPVQLSGNVSAEFPGLLLLGDAFRTQGTATVELFGGTVTITELQGENLSRPWWRLAFSAQARRLDLAQLTRTFGWGRASGLLGASVKGMVISAGEPERFEIELWNEPQAGVPQTLTVEVLDRLPVIRSVAPVLRAAGVETLQYDALGLWCRLERDRLWVRGTAAERLAREPAPSLPILGPLLEALGGVFSGPEPEGEFLVVGRSGFRPLNVILEPVPEEGLPWPAIWRGLRTAVGEAPTVETR